MLFNCNPIKISNDPPLLYKLMESKVNYDKVEKTSIYDLANAFRPYLFDFNYPLEEKYREHFETSFLKHFMLRRIGFETFTSFKLMLDAKLNEIMPKYNKMFEGFEKLDFDGISESEVKSDEENGESSTTSENDNRFSNLPQNEITDVKNGSYMTDYTFNQNKGSSTAKRNNTTTTNRNKLDSIDEYKRFLEISESVYTKIFKECEDLFYSLI